MKLFWQTAAVFFVVTSVLSNEFVQAFYGTAIGVVFALIAISCNK